MDRDNYRLERRKHKRFKLKDQALVFDSTTLGRILDIGMGGLSFQYYHFGETPRLGESEVDILCNVHGYLLSELPAKVVSDVCFDDRSGVALSAARRRSIQFGELSPHQTALLEFFLENYTEEAEKPA